MIVEYEAVDSAGRRVADTVEAPDVRSAVETLRKRDLFVTNVVLQSEGRERRTGTKKMRASEESRREQVTSGSARLSAKQLTMFTRQMAMLLTSGSGLVPALSSIGRQFSKPEQAEMIRQLCRDLEDGSPLTEALQRFPRVFDCSYCAIIAAGEASGTLAEMFTRLAKVVGKRRTMKNKIIGALVYPALLMGLSSTIVCVLMFFVLPRFGEMFRTMDVDLPSSTATLLAVSSFARSNLLLCGAVGATVIGGLVAGFTSGAGRGFLLDMLTQVQVARRLIHGLLMGESFRVLGMLLEARVGLLEAIALVKGVTRNVRFQELYSSMETQVTSGGAISQALESSGVIPPYICHAVHTGEESGNLGSSMTYVADVLDEDNAELLETLTKLFEPAILIVMGSVVGSVAVSLFLPMFDVTAAVG